MHARREGGTLIGFGGIVGPKSRNVRVFAPSSSLALVRGAKKRSTTRPFSTSSAVSSLGPSDRQEANRRMLPRPAKRRPTRWRKTLTCRSPSNVVAQAPMRADPKASAMAVASTSASRLRWTERGSAFPQADQGPTPNEIADRQRWEELSATSLERTQAAAEKWRNGLAAS